MSETIYLLTISLPIGALIYIFSMRYDSKAQQAKARLANDEAYREMAEKVAAAQSETATALASLQTTLSDVATRMTSIEKILKDVG